MREPAPMDRIGVLFLTNYRPVGWFETHLLSILHRNTVLVLLGTPAAHLAGVPDRISLGGIDLVVALFNAHREQLIHEERLDPGKVRIVWNGVDVDEFRRRPAGESRICTISGRSCVSRKPSTATC
jgi:hypothetical protein